MDCWQCGEENPERARFCMACGQRLVITCPACGNEVSPVDAACAHCDHALVEAGEPPPGAQNGPPSTDDKASHGTTPGPADGLAEASSSPLLAPYIPAELLSKLEAARDRGASLGEGRIVTVLFCDVEGSTAAAQGINPDDWAAIMNGAFEHLIPPVYRYEGTLARLIGDGILAFFGAPIAHEDSPERAVLAGLDILKGVAGYSQQVQNEWDMDFSVRVGLHTGTVMVGEIGADLRVKYTAMGDAVHTAALMEQTAAANSVQISEALHRLVAPRFEVTDLGAVAAPGAGRPVHAYRVLRTRPEPEEEPVRGSEGLHAEGLHAEGLHAEGLHAPLIGRQQELSALRQAVAGVEAGQGRIAAVMGEAGVGKSRLTAELRAMLADEGVLDERVRWLEGRSSGYRQQTPFAPFIHLISDVVGLRPAPDDAGRWQRLLDGLAPHTGDAAEELAPFLAALLAIPVPERLAQRLRFLKPPELAEQIFSAVLRLVEILAQHRPLVLVLEDLHWSDGPSLQLLEQLMPLTGRAPLMIVGVFRPEDSTAGRQFHRQASEAFPDRYLPLALQPLGDADARQLLASLLEIEGLPERVRELILDRARGNPFFLEEVLRVLIDDGAIVRDGPRWRASEQVHDVTVPQTLPSLLTARLNQLPEEVRAVVQMASVIGRKFPVDVLAALDGMAQDLEAALGELQRRELVWEQTQVPRRVYRFKHVLMQEAAYNSLPRGRRRQLHGRLARHVVNAEPERVADIAQHFWQAGERLKAFPYLIEAGDQAAARHASGEAVRWYQRALEMVGEVEELDLLRRLYEGYGSMLTLTGDLEEAEAIYETLLACATENDETSMRIAALNKLALVGGLMRQDFDEADRRLDAAAALAREHGDLDGLGETSRIRAMKGTLIADFDGVMEQMGELADMSRKLKDKGWLAMSLEQMAAQRLYQTRYDEAWETVQEAIAVAEEAGDLLHESMARSVQAQIQLRNGDLDAARDAATKGLAVARQSRAAVPLAMNGTVLGQLNLLQGNFQAALDRYETALTDSRISTAAWMRPLALAGLGTVHLRIGGENREQGLAYHEEAETLLTSHFGSVTGAFVCAELGYCALGDGELERAAAFMRQGLSESGALQHVMRPLLLVGSALVAIGRGDPERADAQLQRARSQVAEAGMRHVVPQLLLAEGRCAAARGDEAEALARFQQTVEEAEGMGMRPLAWEALQGSERLLTQAGRTEEAKATGEAAAQALAEMADLFRDAELRARFLGSHGSPQ